MKCTLFCGILFFLVAFKAHTQADSSAFESLELLSTKLRYFNKSKTTLDILNVWGGSNMLVGSYALLTDLDKIRLSEAQRGFHQMNVGWGAINLGIGILGTVRLRKQIYKIKSIAELNKERKRTKNIFLINSFLDLGYMAAGTALINQNSSQRLVGFGSSILMQGAFLLVLDAVSYCIHLRKYNKNRF